MTDTDVPIDLMEALLEPLKDEVISSCLKTSVNRVGTPMAYLSMFSALSTKKSFKQIESCNRLLFSFLRALTCILRPVSYISMETEIHVPAMSIIKCLPSDTTLGSSYSLSSIYCCKVNLIDWTSDFSRHVFV